MAAVGHGMTSSPHVRDIWRDARQWVDRTGSERPQRLRDWLGRLPWGVDAQGASGARSLRRRIDAGSTGRSISYPLHPDASLTLWLQGRLEDYECLLRALNEYEIETVLHLAPAPPTDRGHRISYILALHSMQTSGGQGIPSIACREISTVKRIVVASSDKAYGNAERLPYDELMPLLGRRPYDVSKSCADLIAQSYHLTYGLPVSITRAANFYGGETSTSTGSYRERSDRFSTGTSPILRSDGTMIPRLHLYPRRCRGHLLLAEAMDDEKFWGQAYNFSLEMQLSVLEITKKILDVMGGPYCRLLFGDEAKAEIPVQ